jgi:hypothetical protein
MGKSKSADAGLTFLANMLQGHIVDLHSMILVAIGDHYLDQLFFKDWKITIF